MSQENVEVVREQFEATNRRDFARPMADWAEDIEVVYRIRDGDIRSGTYSGREAVGEFFGSWFREFRRVQFELLEIRDGGDSVAVAVRHRAQGKHTGIEVGDDFFYEYRLRGGKIVRITFHLSWSGALEAVGLREQAMSQENVEVVRSPLRVRERPSGPLDQRLLLRFPSLAVISAQLLNRLSPRSRLRRAALSRASVLAIEGFNRGEYDLALLSHHPHCEYRPPREMIEAGLVKPCYRGHAGYRELMTDWSHAGDLHLEDVELIDLGDRWVLLAALALRWRQRADTPFSRMWACVITLEGGRPIREEYYWNHAEALEAVGLRE